MPHVATIFIEIIRLYALVMDKEEIPKEKLKKTFITFINILEEEINDPIDYDYEKELREFLSLRRIPFFETEKSIVWEDDIETIYASYCQNRSLKSMDFKIAELVLNVDIYDALDLKIDNSLIAPFFNYNQQLMQAFTNVAYHEFTNRPLPLQELKRVHDNFLSLFDDLDNQTLMKLRVAHHIYDFKYAAHLCDYKFFPWYIILFSFNTQEWQLITYNTIATLCEDFDEIQDAEGEELQNAFITDENPNYILNTYEIFLKVLIIYINKFLGSVNSFPGRETVITKKYLLLSLPELGDTLETLIEEETLDSISIKDTEYELNRDELRNIYLESMDAIDLLLKKDTDLAKEKEFYANMILAAFFIKSFFQIAPSNYRENLTTILINPKYYKNPSYKTYTDILDNIILSNYFDLTR